MSEVKRWRTFSVHVEGFDPFTLSAENRGRAMAEAYSRFSEPYPDVRFGEFVKRTRIRSAEPPRNDGYDYVRRTYGVDVKVGQRVTLQNEGPKFNGRGGQVVYPGASTSMVHVVLDGQRHVSLVHPLNVAAARPTSGGEHG